LHWGGTVSDVRFVGPPARGVGKRAFAEAVSPNGRPWEGRVDLLEISQPFQRPQHDGWRVDMEVSS
jgi:hypothetical protein